MDILKRIIMDKKCKVLLIPHGNQNTSITMYLPERKLSTNLDKLQHHTNHHIYITSDDEITEGDWYLDYHFGAVTQAVNYINTLGKDTHYKIIATTDYLVEGFRWNKEFTLPQLSPKFLKFYCDEYNSGNKIEEVSIEYDIYNDPCDKFGIPNSNIIEYKITPEDNTVLIKTVKDSWDNEELMCRLFKCWEESFRKTFDLNEDGFQIFINKYIKSNERH